MRPRSGVEIRPDTIVMINTAGPTRCGASGLLGANALSRARRKFAAGLAIDVFPEKPLWAGREARSRRSLDRKLPGDDAEEPAADPVCDQSLSQIGNNRFAIGGIKGGDASPGVLLPSWNERATMSAKMSPKFKGIKPRWTGRVAIRTQVYAFGWLEAPDESSALTDPPHVKDRRASWR